MKTILLPPSEETMVKIVAGDQSAEIELVELDFLFVRASKDAKESGKHWVDEGVKLMKSGYKLTLSKSQIAILYEGVQSELGELKRGLLNQLKPSKD